MVSRIFNGRHSYVSILHMHREDQCEVIIEMVVSYKI